MKTQTISRLDLQNDFDLADSSSQAADPPTSYINFGCRDSEEAGQKENQESPGPTLQSHPVPFHTLVLDMAGVCFIDLMGIKVLMKMNTSYKKLGIRLYFANIQAQVYQDLEEGGAFDDGNISNSDIFISVHDAVLFAQQTAADRPKEEKVAQEFDFEFGDDSDLEKLRESNADERRNPAETTSATKVYNPKRTDLAAQDHVLRGYDSGSTTILELTKSRTSEHLPRAPVTGHGIGERRAQSNSRDQKIHESEIE
ncbi:hypothetical protein WMY93_028069 [Mugilogobius chulae]|uniref:STAS domain-containing protein n=1 Tax=Mugilogobius chulae TaxID=88201 RepID=A0AAW0MVT5_9GOBI